MKITRTLYALAAITLASPAMAVDAVHRDASHQKGAASSPAAAASTTHPCRAKANRDGALRCGCTPAQDERRGKGNWSTDSEPVPDYGG